MNSLIFGTNDNLDGYILNKLETEGIDYLLQCYENLKNNNGTNEQWYYFQNYYKLYLTNWSVNYNKLNRYFIKQEELFDLTLQLDETNYIFNNLLVNLDKFNFEELLKIGKIFLKNDFVLDMIINSNYWNNEKSFLGIIINSVKHDNEWKNNIIKLHKIFLRFLKYNKKVTILWLSSILNNKKTKKQIGSIQHFNNSDYIFMTNFTGLIYYFWLRGRKIKNFNKIRIEYLKNNNSGLDWLLDESKKQQYTFLEDVFFMTLRSLDLSLVSIYDNIILLKKEINRLEFLMNNYQNNSDFNSEINETMRLFNMKRYESMIKDKKQEIKENKNILESSIIKPWLNNYLKDLMILFSKVKIEHDEILTFIINGHQILVDFDSNIETIKLFIDIFGGKYTNNPHIRTKAFDYVLNLFDNKMIIKYLYDNQIQNTILLNSIILYNDMESAINFTEKYNYKTSISLLIKNLCRNKEYYNILIDISINHNKIFQKFISFVLSDLTQILDEGLQKIKDISYKEHNQEEDVEEKSEEISKIKGCMYFSNNMLNFINFISNDSTTNKLKNILLSEEIKDKFINMISFYLEKMVGKESKKLIVNNPEIYNFNPLEILHKLSCIFSWFFNNEKFVDLISKENSLSLNYLKKMINILSRKSKLEWDNSGKLCMLSEKIELKTKLNQQIIEYENVPTEFCDPIFMSILEDPVLLPNMDIFVENSVIKRHLLTNEENPFNREKLSISQLQEYNNEPNNLIKLNNFKNKLNKWKQNYKNNL